MNSTLEHQTSAPTASEQFFAKLAAMIAALDDPLIKLPTTADIHVSPVEPRTCRSEIELQLDIDMGGFILPLALAVVSLEIMSDEMVGYTALKVCERVREAAAKRSYLVRRLAQVRENVAARIARADVGMRMVEAGLARVPIGWPFHAGCAVVAKIEMLNSALATKVEVLEEPNHRCLGRAIGIRVVEQRRRAARRQRLRDRGALLEIDEAAERAIVAAGRSVGEIAALLSEVCDDDDPRSRCVDLHGSAGIDRVGVQLLDGLIRITGSLPVGGTISGERVTIDREIPASVALALRGLRAEQLFELPFLEGVALHSVKVESGQTIAILRLKKRGISSAEIWPQPVSFAA